MTRIVSLIGCIVFLAYGLLIESGSIIVTNGVLAVVQIYSLARGK